MNNKCRTLHNEKASSMLCLLASLNLRNSKCVSMAMLEVNATGMENCIPGCVARANMPSRTLFWDMCIYRRGHTLYSSTHRAILRAQRSRRVGVDTHAFFVMYIVLILFATMCIVAFQLVYYEY